MHHAQSLSRRFVRKVRVKLSPEPSVWSSLLMTQHRLRQASLLVLLHRGRYDGRQTRRDALTVLAFYCSCACILRKLMNKKNKVLNYFDVINKKGPSETGAFLHWCLVFFD